MKVIKVKSLRGYRIDVSFEDGVNGIIDLTELVKKGIFQELRDEILFSNVYTTGYSIAWSEELEIDALTIYAELLGKSPEEVFQSPHYASN
ncbi:DUF2442 domain-containing protein [Daejeonella sp.]|uniref:DUF2442 domain-containing protein n=1 Tax=Daejeonella sp. TaxID=2805397 RepID=UPI0030BB5907